MKRDLVLLFLVSLVVSCSDDNDQMAQPLKKEAVEGSCQYVPQIVSFTAPTYRAVYCMSGYPFDIDPMLPSRRRSDTLITDKWCDEIERARENIALNWTKFFTKEQGCPKKDLLAICTMERGKVYMYDHKYDYSHNLIKKDPELFKGYCEERKGVFSEV